MPVVKAGEKICLCEGLQGLCMTEEEHFVLHRPFVTPIALLKMVKSRVARLEAWFCLLGLSLNTS